MKPGGEEKIVPAFTALLWGIVCVLIAAAPLLLAHSCAAAAMAAYFPFSFFCHQNPERSFFIMQFPMAVCHRCTGIYLGLFLGSLGAISYFHGSLRMRRIRVSAAILPLLLDVLLSSTGLWTGAWWSRFFTGLLFGYLISPLLVQGLKELHAGYGRRLGAADELHIKGDLS